MQLNGKGDAEDRQKYSEARVLINEYASRHSLPSIGSSVRSTSPKPFTCFEMYVTLSDLWVNKESDISLSDVNTAEGLRRILLQVFKKYEIANTQDGTSNGQSFPALMNGWDTGKMDKTLAQIIKEHHPQ